MPAATAHKSAPEKSLATVPMEVQRSPPEVRNGSQTLSIICENHDHCEGDILIYNVNRINAHIYFRRERERKREGGREKDICHLLCPDGRLSLPWHHCRDPEAVAALIGGFVLFPRDQNRVRHGT